jgi:DEAD/DEAH box helicase domain-containing protein
LIPTALVAQLQRGMGDFLRTSFWSNTPGFEHLIDGLLETSGGLFQGPYVSLKLPFRPGTGGPGVIAELPLGFTPYIHQEQAFRRLTGNKKLNTLIATGTGSGKTECFLLPILADCLRRAGSPGVKAILIYPMNALATDQAQRLARLIHGNDRLRHAVTAGLYIGQAEKNTHTVLGPTT